jgi:hypothetical protein
MAEYVDRDKAAAGGEGFEGDDDGDQGESKHDDEGDDVDNDKDGMVPFSSCGNNDDDDPPSKRSFSVVGLLFVLLFPESPNL